MREKIIEQCLVKAVKKQDGMCPKFVSPGMNGMPDRIVLMPGGRIAFAEVKAPGRKPRPLQLRRHEQLRRLGFEVFVLDDPEQINSLLFETSSPVKPSPPGAQATVRPALDQVARSAG